MGTLYWSIVILLLGGCIGSFLNVVIYRWPRGLSVRQPARSFCPNCETAIAWHDNVPVISYLLLRGRCRKCRARISPQYPLVELATALLFVMTYDAFFVAKLRQGITGLESDWPILIAHWALWAGMVAITVMDLEEYMVDITVTWVVSAAGLLGHAFWTPASSVEWIRPGPEAAAMSVAAAAGLLIGALLFLRAPAEEELPPEQAGTVQSPLRSPRWWPLLLVPVTLVGVYVAAMSVAAQPGTARLLAGLAGLFAGLAAVASNPHPEADAEVHETGMSEAPDSRRVALFELKAISPAVVLGIAAVVILRNSPTATDGVARVLHWSPTGEWQPLWGLATGLAGWVIGGAVGWLSRIVFTLIFGKEALGIGDIHILAAAGAVAGWPVAFLGFFLAAPLALLAMIVIHIRRPSRWVPYGPWLALAFLVACLFQDRILNHFAVRWMLAPPPD